MWKHCSVLKSTIYITNSDACLKLSLLVSCHNKKLHFNVQSRIMHHLSEFITKHGRKECVASNFRFTDQGCLTTPQGSLWELGSRFGSFLILLCNLLLRFFHVLSARYRPGGNHVERRLRRLREEA